MTIKLACQQCGERMTMDLATMTVYCPHCGFHPSTGLDERAAENRARGPRPEVAISNEQNINPRAVSCFDSAQDSLFQGNKGEALHDLQEALALQPDFLEAHLLIAKTTNNAKIKRDHLDSVLAYDPGNTEATRLMLMLDGRLTPEQATRSYNDDGPEVKSVSAPVTTETVTLKCPNCKGDLTVDDTTNRVKCRFCGYQGFKPAQRESRSESLVAAMLERKGQAVKWVIGERILQCSECGASQTLTENQLSAHCPFCGSNHVIEQDALGSFEQPDSLIPFKISREEAGTRIKEQMHGFGERVKGWFDNNKIASARLNGYYLPFWLFDAMVEISQTVISNNSSGERGQRMKDPYQRTVLNDAVYDVEICAVKSPPMGLVHRLGEFPANEIVAYAPELLAKYPAQLYTVDFDQAALGAHGLISTLMRAKHAVRETKNTSVSVFSTIRSMSFRLVLVPVWIAHLIEADKDERIALVHGQSGKVVMGQTEKHKNSAE